MPICEIVCKEGLLSAQEADRIVERLCPILLDAEGLPDTPAARALCLINITSTAHTYIGGRPAAQGKILVRIHAFANAYSDATKSMLYEHITRIFCEEHPASQAAGGSNVWCLILTLEPGNFGVGGIPVSLEMTRAIATKTHSA